MEAENKNNMSLVTKSNALRHRANEKKAMLSVAKDELAQQILKLKNKAFGTAITGTYSRLLTCNRYF